MLDISVVFFLYTVYEPPIGLTVANNFEAYTDFVSLDVHSIQTGHLPQGPAESQTGDVTAATRLRIGQRRLITTPQYREEAYDGQIGISHDYKWTYPASQTAVWTSLRQSMTETM